jgi:hypothetical protein
MNNLTTPMAILISGVLIAIAIFVSLSPSQTYYATCKFNKSTMDVKWLDTVKIKYTTGGFWNQSFVTNDIQKLKNVKTFKNHAEGYIHADDMEVKFIYNGVSKSLYIEAVKDDVIQYVTQYFCK